ncbi:MAG: hypothetical protein ACRYFU_26635 [Janthinobacterium lividum]
MPKSQSNIPKMGTLTMALLLSSGALGCHRQPKTAEGSMVRPGQPGSVDNSWINAAKSCWPQLASNGYGNDDIARNLIHHLGAAFPTYSALGNKGTDADLSMPLDTVLAPDVTKLQNSSTPVLTRGQAVAGVGPQGAIVQSTNGSAPPDALCSIQTGLPQGFSK